MASSGLRENVILTKIIFSIDGTTACAKSDMWCHMVWHKILMQDQIHSIVFGCRYKLCSPLYSRQRCGTGVVGNDGGVI